MPYRGRSQLMGWSVNALSGLYLISTYVDEIVDEINEVCQCPLGLIPHFYNGSTGKVRGSIGKVSMPSRAYTSFLPTNRVYYEIFSAVCQCPLGLIPHFYYKNGFKEDRSELPCQCPLGLIPHFYLCRRASRRNKWSVSMPSRAYTSFLLCRMERITCRGLCCVSMPSRAYTSFLRYPFKNLGFMRFPEPVFAVICQNILATAVFRAC